MKIYARHLIISFIGLLFIIFLACACAGDKTRNFAGLGNGSDKIPLTEKALTGTLPNGLKYYILENQRPENRAHLALVVNAGSVLENDDERGFAHFVEHLAFNDTARFPKLELIEYLRSLGMRFGADANAYTYYDETVYHFDVPVEEKDGIKKIPDKALAILDDWTYAVSFLPQDVASESLVVLEEFRTRLGAMERVRKITMPVLFEGSAYADREVIGLSHIIENAQSRQLKAFYDRWYKSDNMALVFVGDFDGKALQADLARHFNMPAAQEPVNRPLYELPPPKKNNFRVQIITDPELTAASFSVYFRQKEGSKRGTLAYYRDSLIDYLIDDMLSRRFAELSLDPDAKSIEAWAGGWNWSSNSRFYTLGTQPKAGEAEPALRELLLEKESMRRYGFTESELERAKLNVVSYLENQLSEKDRRESRLYIRNFTSHIIHGEDMADIEWEMEAVNSMLPAIGLKEITAAVKKYFETNDCIVFLIAPQADSENLPSEEKIKAVFNETAKAKIKKRKSDSLSGDLLERPPVPGKIIDEKADGQTGAKILSLSNGTEVILRETSNKNNEIIMYAIANGGTNNAPLEDIVSAKLASEMISVSGLGPYSHTELINKLSGKQVSVSFSVSSNTRGFQGSSTIKDLKTLFEMIHLYFTKPGLDERAVAAMIDQYRTNLIHQDDDPQNVFSRELTKTIYNNHPRYMPLELADMDRVSVDKALDFIKRCVNPSDYTFVFTGNFDISQMRELLAMYIASIPAAVSMNSWTDPVITRPAPETKKIINKGQDERSMVFLAWFTPGPSEFDEKRNQTAAVLTEYLDILLTDEIREKLGGVYSISCGASVNVIPSGEYTINAFFNCSPARADELAAAVIERITMLTRQPLNTDTFNKAKEALLKQHENSLQRNLYIAQSYANSAVLYNTPLARLNDRPQVINSVTAGDVRSLCGDMLAGGPVTVILFPEGWK
ncbi:MAG: insulinase family protein [Treponema sp.]|jgi:zinc protease|nr:insulinase family protein [Treponema sp.]